MTKKQLIELLANFPDDMEVVLIVDNPEEFPRKITGVEPDDFNEINRIAILTKMEAA